MSQPGPGYKCKRPYTNHSWRVLSSVPYAINGHDGQPNGFWGAYEDCICRRCGMSHHRRALAVYAPSRAEAQAEIEGRRTHGMRLVVDNSAAA
jgi:hypothetical protein